MDRITEKSSNNKDLFLKIALFAATVILLVLVLPKEGKFRYEFTKGKPWLHDDLYAPFDFAIIKYENELKAEQEDVLSRLKPFFTLDTAVYLNQKLQFEDEFDTSIPDEEAEKIQTVGAAIDYIVKVAKEKD